MGSPASCLAFLSRRGRHGLRPRPVRSKLADPRQRAAAQVDGEGWGKATVAPPPGGSGAARRASPPVVPSRAARKIVSSPAMQPVQLRVARPRRSRRQARSRSRAASARRRGRSSFFGPSSAAARPANSAHPIEVGGTRKCIHEPSLGIASCTLSPRPPRCRVKTVVCTASRPCSRRARTTSDCVASGRSPTSRMLVLPLELVHASASSSWVEAEVELPPRETVSAGVSRSTRSPAVPIRTPAAPQASTDWAQPAARASAPRRRPRPRTSTTPGSAARRAEEPCSPFRRTEASRSASTVSTTAHAAAHVTGLPPKVLAWSPGSRPAGAARRPQGRPHRKPVAEAFGERDRVGRDAQSRSQAKSLPVRPTPVPPRPAAGAPSRRRPARRRGTRRGRWIRLALNRPDRIAAVSGRPPRPAAVWRGSASQNAQQAPTLRGPLPGCPVTRARRPSGRGTVVARDHDRPPRHPARPLQSRFDGLRPGVAEERAGAAETLGDKVRRAVPRPVS